MVTGITYIYSQRISSGQLTLLLKNAPVADLKILLVHQPSKMVIKVAEENDYDILLAGHTHGGQFFPWNIFASIGQPFIKGLHKYPTKSGAGWVYVSKGTGYWGPPLRVNARSEIGVFVLQKA